MKNESGIYPIDYKVLVKKDEVEKQTDGGIWIPETTQEREAYQQELGTLIEMGSMAFTRVDIAEQEKLFPGQRVMISKYAGSRVRGIDKKFYQLCNDLDVTAIIREDGNGN